MSNELIFLLSAFTDILLVFVAARKGSDWLLSTIAANLIIIATFGAKIITVFGLTTNAGNAFYACVFLATYFLIEKQGRQAAIKTIGFGAIFILFFIIVAQFVNNFIGSDLSSAVNECIDIVFHLSLRVALASIGSYIFAQYINISIYDWLKTKTKSRSLWLRASLANIVSQLVDSLLFFSIAFFDLPGTTLVQMVLIGWLIKTIVVGIGIPFLYLDKHLSRKK